MSNGKRIRLRRFGLGAVLVAGLGVLALGSGMSDPTTSVDPNNSNYYFVTYTVTPSAGEEIKDFHLLPLKHKLEGAPQDPDGRGPWTAGGSGKGFHWWTSGAALTGPMEFKIRVRKGFRFNDVKWITTSDGDNDPKDGVIDGDAGNKKPGPTSGSDIADAIATIPINSTTSLPIDSTEESQDFQVYALSTVDGAPDPWDDWDGFVEFAGDHPVPAGWNLTFQSMTGSVDEEGYSNAPSVTVPNDEGLSGNVFYLVVGVEDEEYAGEWIPSWPAQAITIQ